MGKTLVQSFPKISHNMYVMHTCHISPSIHRLNTPIHAGSRGGCCFQQSLGKWWGKSWTGRQSATGQHSDTQYKQPYMNTLIPKVCLERPVNHTVMFFDCSRKPEYPQGTHTCMGRTCKLHAEIAQAGIHTHDLLATRQRCYQLPTLQSTVI
ncbi:hypothetical protein ATANTOWER_006971 [Ataeniobius toweri]|uniref:Uncharacterized protein n=1 Tax=Ataeniobius toweri TaxID=208326 RepID=A0ABU7C599_9TELE|nr:hypothetical protein [Ataeniobius toweri]